MLCSSTIKSFLSFYIQLSDFTSEIANTPAGTEDYKAPEIIRRESHDKSVDIWSFGICCYEIISFERPFSTPADVLDFHFKYKPLDENTPVLETDLVDMMLQRNPSDRPKAGEISAKLSHKILTIIY